MEQSQLYQLDTLIEFRRDIHKHAEIYYQEKRTNAKILEYLRKLGIKEEQIRQVALTGIIVDIQGQGPPSGNPKRIAFRADMDALPIKEINPDIDFGSVTEASHMCGHDLHMTCLLGGAAKILEKIDQIPSDKHVRLLFQPAEERLGGAFCMIQEGVLLGVDEVYGMHNIPQGEPGEMYVQKGYMTACVTSINLTIYGKGGHSSTPEILKDPLQPAIDIHVGLRELIKEYKDKGEQFTVTMPLIKTGNAPNAISDTCIMQGFLRAFGEDFIKEFKGRLHKLVQDSCAKYGCTADAEIISMYPAIWNTDKETENLVRVGKKVLGEGKVRSDSLPLYAGEDFSYFSRVVPGAFFLLTSDSKESKGGLHTCHFNPSEDVIPIGCEVWYRLVEDRFEINFK